MTLTGRAAYRLAGHQFADEDFDKNANIQVAKLGTRTLSYTIPATAFNLNGAGTVKTFSGVFGGVTLPDAATGEMFAAIPIPPEYASGDVILTILWSSTATSNDIKLTSEIKPIVDGVSHFVSATDTGTDTAKPDAGRINQMNITIAAADFKTASLETVLGLKISRDPTDGSDTLSANIIVHAVDVVFTGRG